MKSVANSFRQNLGATLETRVGRNFKFAKSKLELSAETPEGANVVLLSGSSKFSPHIGIAFYFGCKFARVSLLERRLGLPRRPFHMQQYSPNCRLMKGLRYEGPGYWNIDIEDPSDTLVDDVTAAIEELALPFFEQFQTLESARQGLAEGNSWSFGGVHCWRDLLLIDFALGDLDHFINWSRQLRQFERQLAEELVDRCRLIGAAEA